MQSFCQKHFDDVFLQGMYVELAEMVIKGWDIYVAN
jgi:hypothetical protein